MCLIYYLTGHITGYVTQIREKPSVPRVINQLEDLFNLTPYSPLFRQWPLISPASALGMLWSRLFRADWGSWWHKTVPANDDNTQTTSQSADCHRKVLTLQASGLFVAYFSLEYWLGSCSSSSNLCTLTCWPVRLIIFTWKSNIVVKLKKIKFFKLIYL